MAHTDMTGRWVVTPTSSAGTSAKYYSPLIVLSMDKGMCSGEIFWEGEISSPA